jgi:predicted transposase YdaD
MLGLRLEETRVYQEASAEGEERGVVKGRREGEQTGALKEAQALILRLLTRRVGRLAPEVLVQVQSLSLAQLESLGEALLDFSQLDDLMNWLNRSRSS